MALDYHKYPRPGKIEVIPTKPYATQADLALAYSPGVAYPCLEIQEAPEKAYDYTDKGNRACRKACDGGKGSAFQDFRRT